jgi:hypothetical protein
MQKISMSKVVPSLLVLITLVGCSSDALLERTGRQELSSSVTASEVDPEPVGAPTTTAKPTTTSTSTSTTVADDELTFDDFRPTCSIGQFDSIGTLYFDVSILNAFKERMSFYLTVDLFYNDEWFATESLFVNDIPSRLTGTDSYLSLRAADGRSSSPLDYSCEVVEFDYR